MLSFNERGLRWCRCLHDIVQKGKEEKSVFNTKARETDAPMHACRDAVRRSVCACVKHHASDTRRILFTYSIKAPGRLCFTNVNLVRVNTHGINCWTF